MGGLDPAKIIMVLLVALVVLGPERLPRAARQLGSMWRELARMRERLESEVRDALPDLDLPKLPVMARHGITGYLAGMMTGSEAAPAATSDLEGFESSAAGQHSYPSSPWVGTAGETNAPNGVPAGWHSVGAPAPGYASGSLLSAVPSVGPVGSLPSEGELSFDDPFWN